jgi:hypothetical protein
LFVMTSNDNVAGDTQRGHHNNYVCPDTVF